MGARETSFGQHRPSTWVDRFGIWLSLRKMRSVFGDVKGKRIADIGCGFHATMGRELAARGAAVTLFDLALADDLKADARITAIEGSLPDILSKAPDGAFDAVLCNNLLEHLWQADEAAAHIRRLLAPGAVAFINVPSWRGKTYLEYSAFRLALSPVEEMEDHKTYYDPEDLLALLTGAGFPAADIDCAKHKFGLNTYAICRRGNA